MKRLLSSNVLFGILLSSIKRPVSASCSNMAQSEVECIEKGVHSIAYVTVPSDVVGKTLGRKIVENRLAACVNIIPQITSIYEWDQKINEDNEAMLMIKTRTSRVEELIKFVRENHPYEVCEVITVQVDNGNPPYLKWINDVVPPQK